MGQGNQENKKNDFFSPDKKEAEISREVANSLEEIEEFLEENRDEFRSVGDILKDEYFIGNEKKKERIYERREQEELPMNEIDEDAYSQMGRVKRLLYFLRPGASKAIHAKSGEKGRFVNTKKLNKEVEDRDLVPDAPGEIEVLAHECGLDISEAKKMNFIKTYKQIDDKIIKIVTRDRTEEEKALAAKKVFEEELRFFEMGEGEDLKKAKENFGNYQKAQQESIKAMELISDESRKIELMEKIKEEEEEKREVINEMEQAIEEKRKEKSELFIMRLDGLKATKEMAVGILDKLKEKESAYRKQIRDINAAIRKLGKFKESALINSEIVVSLEEELAQTQVNFEAIVARRADVVQKVSVINMNIKDYEKIIKRINMAGKTLAELREERKSDTKKGEDGVEGVVKAGTGDEEEKVIAEDILDGESGVGDKADKESVKQGNSKEKPEKKKKKVAKQDKTEWSSDYETDSGIKVVDKRTLNKEELKKAREAIERKPLKLKASEWVKLVAIKDKQQRKFKAIIRAQEGKYKGDSIFSDTKMRIMIKRYARDILNKKNDEAEKFVRMKINSIRNKKLNK